MKRSNHYEAAFEQFVREKGLTCIAVDEAKRAIFGAVELKSFDFIAYVPGMGNSSRSLLIDIKGRKARGTKRGWSFDCWVSQSDIEALDTWQHVFGGGFAATLVFAFWLSDLEHVDLFEPFEFRNRYYRFLAVPLDDYRRHLRPRSARWNTVSIPRSIFKTIAVDFNDLIKNPNTNR